MPCFETCIIRKQKGAPKTHFWRARLASLTFCMRRFSRLCPAILRQITRKIRDDQQIFSIHGFRARGEMDEINFPSCKIGKPSHHRIEDSFAAVIDPVSGDPIFIGYHILRGHNLCFAAANGN